MWTLTASLVQCLTDAVSYSRVLYKRPVLTSAFSLGKSGSVCGVYGGKKGCCPIGKSCNFVGGCEDEDYLPCIDIDHCCPPSYTCTVDGCTLGGGVCDAGFSPCENSSNGCCPTGSRCILPSSCDVACKPSDPVCGTGCCFEGYVCGDNLKCKRDGSDVTSLEPPQTTVPTARFTPADVLDTSAPTDEPTSSEESTDEPTSSEESTDEPTSSEESTDEPTSSKEPTNTGVFDSGDDTSTTDNPYTIVVTMPIPSIPKISVVTTQSVGPHVTSALAAPTLCPGVFVLGFAAAGAVGILAI